MTVARVGSFCSGIGGLDMGAADALGGTHAWFAESDPGASAVLAARFPGVPNHGDLTSFDWSRAEPVDVVCMGFPCQPFSAAGLQLGTAVERWAAVAGPPPPPREVSARGGERLSAKFVEWMNGLPAGFVTGVPGLSNAAVMRCLGNMVVPRFAAAVVGELHTELTIVVNWHLTSGTRAVML